MSIASAPLGTNFATATLHSLIHLRISAAKPTSYSGSLSNSVKPSNTASSSNLNCVHKESKSAVKCVTVGPRSGCSSICNAKSCTALICDIIFERLILTRSKSRALRTLSLSVPLAMTEIKYYNHTIYA